MDGQAVIYVSTAAWRQAPKSGSLNSRPSTLKAVEAGPEAWFFEQAALVPLEGCDPRGGVFDGPGASQVHFNPAAAGLGDHQLTYTCTDQYGCAASDTRQVHVMAAPVLKIDGPQMLKAGQTARLYTEAGHQHYTWYRDGKAMGTHSHELTTAEAGTYHVAVSQQGATISTNAIGIYQAVEASDDQNYIAEHTILQEGVKDAAEVAGLNAFQKATGISYFDGLGRPLQTINAQASPAMADLVVPVVYDRFGRDSIQYLPYAASGVSGAFRAGAVAGQGDFYSKPPLAVASDPNPWAVRVLETSPLGTAAGTGCAREQPGNLKPTKAERP